MWNHPATQANIRTLRERGHLIVDPTTAPWPAHGRPHPWRTEAIADAVAGLTKSKRDLEGEIILITAGPTQEPLDAGAT